jgi:hypothetical protein
MQLLFYKYGSLLILLLLPTALFCQYTISGRVVSEKQEPLQHASVFISNSTSGTVTNARGEFVLSNVPEGVIKLAVSYVGYKTLAITIPAAAANKQYLIQLEPRNNVMDAVIVDSYDKNGWKNWSDVFIAAFIGTSSYAEQCTIRNKDALHFVYVESSRQLRVYASEPVIIENRSLGYRITVNLADFTYNTENKDVDYQLYTFFEQLKGTPDEMDEWKRNRTNAYSLSFMHFMRALYADNLKNEGFEVRLLEKKKNTEKERIQNLYKTQFSRIKDSLSSRELKASVINKMIGKTFNKDSLRYYRKVLEQDDRTKKLHTPLLSFQRIAKRADSNTVLVQFQDYLHIIYNKTKEPGEYTLYKTENNQEYVPSALASGEKMLLSKGYPVSELTLQQGIPVEVNKNGYFTNIDLFINGFWGWWEKMATRLPYEYQPDNAR